jgi:ankyrin repeat protein
MSHHDGEKKHVDHQDSFGNTALMIAANQGDFLKVKSLCEGNVAAGNPPCDVNKQDKYGQTALVFAAFSGYQDIVEILLKYKAQPDIQTKFGQTALMKAAFSNSHHIMSLLVQAGANVNLQCMDGRTALSIAGQCNNLKM